MSETTNQDQDVAPDFDTEGYPSKGKRIGPAWQRVWEVLADRRWHDGVELSVRLAVAAPEVAVKTIRELLNTAGRLGVLERTEVFNVVSRRWHTHYRRPQ